MLANKLKKIITEKDLAAYRSFIENIADELGVDCLDCAAALSFLYQSGFGRRQDGHENSGKPHTRTVTRNNSEIKMVRYRLEVGRKHRISVEALKKLLVDETGVEKKQIGYIDIHNHYTLIRLPEGMPADIFNHLKSVQINQRSLCIKRLGNNGRRKLNMDKKPDKRVKSMQGKGKNNTGRTKTGFPRMIANKSLERK